MNDMTLPTPTIGQMWQYHDGSPWPSTSRPVRVIDVIDGWVRYSQDTGLAATDERNTVACFLTLFRPYVEPSA